MPEFTFLLYVIRWLFIHDENHVENRAKMRLWRQVIKLSSKMTSEATLYNLSDGQIIRPLGKLVAYPLGGLNAWRRKPEVLFVVIHPNNRAIILSRMNPQSAFILKREIIITDTGEITMLAEKQYHSPRLSTQAETEHLELKLRNQEPKTTRINRLLRYITSTRPTPRLHRMIRDATAEVKQIWKVIEPWRLEPYFDLSEKGGYDADLQNTFYISDL